MPYRSKAQRGWLHVHEPEIAKKWDKKYGGKIVPKKKVVRKVRKTNGKKKGTAR